MKRLIATVQLHFCLIFFVNAQTQLEIQGVSTSPDTVAIIKANYNGGTNAVGLGVYSRSNGGEYGASQPLGIGGYFFGGEIGIYGESISQAASGVVGVSLKGNGVTGVSTHGNGVGASSTTGYGITAESEEGDGAYFRGGSGFSITIDGSNSPCGAGSDDAVIRSNPFQSSGDLILVTNDAFHVHLDDDNTNSSSFKVINGLKTDVLILDEAGNLTITGAYSPSSDIDKKENIQLIDIASILEKLVKIPISEWQFKGESIRHVGPMAQDFYEAFRLGQGETTIATVDADGIALAAIKALHEQTTAQSLSLFALD